MTTKTTGKDVITLEPTTDPGTGLVVYQAPVPAVPETATVDGGRVRVDGTDNQVTLTDERFAADPAFDWGRAEQAQAAGETVQIIDGQLVTNNKATAPGQSVTLTDERFAATTPQETAEVVRLVRSGTATALISDLRPTSEIRQHLPSDPGGWYLRTKPTPSFGDVLHTVIVRRSATGLYHAHLWRFMQNDRGQLKSVDLNRWVGAHASLSAHHTHLYPGQHGESAVLCLSQARHGWNAPADGCRAAGREMGRRHGPGRARRQLPVSPVRCETSSCPGHLGGRYSSSMFSRPS